MQKYISILRAQNPNSSIESFYILVTLGEKGMNGGFMAGERSCLLGNPDHERIRETSAKKFNDIYTSITSGVVCSNYS